VSWVLCNTANNIVLSGSQPEKKALLFVNVCLCITFIKNLTKENIALIKLNVK